MASPNYEYVHIISDSTGQTAHSVAESCIIQFRDSDINFRTKIWPMVRTEKDLEQALSFIKLHLGVIIFTVSDFSLRNRIRNFAQDHKIPATSPISQFLINMSRYYNLPLPNSIPGSHLEMNEDYFKKIDSLQYAQEHDDGANIETISKADIIIIGISRTSKSPISFYLAHRGFNVANIPYFYDVDFPIDPKKYKNSLVIGLAINPKALSLIRQERMEKDFGSKKISGSFTNSSSNRYTNHKDVSFELKEALRFFAKNKIPCIDVTKKAVEETAAEIIKLYDEKFNAF